MSTPSEKNSELVELSDYLTRQMRDLVSSENPVEAESVCLGLPMHLSPRMSAPPRACECSPIMTATLLPHLTLRSERGCRKRNRGSVQMGSPSRPHANPSTQQRPSCESLIPKAWRA